MVELPVSLSLRGLRISLKRGRLVVESGKVVA